MTTMPPRIPPLKDGDRLTADEFMRRYEATPPGVRAQLIGGIVYMASPLRAEHHGDPHAEIVGWLMHYKSATPGVQPSIGATVRLADDAVPEPDASMRITRGGRTRIEGGYIVRGPELAVEISASTLRTDRTAKFQDYQTNGVQEYIIWAVEEGTIEWFRLIDGQYVSLVADGGLLKSVVFPGLWLDPAAMLAFDVGRVLEVLRLGLATPEHAAFVAALAAAPP